MLRVLECDLDGRALDDAQFHRRFGPGPHAMPVRP